MRAISHNTSFTHCHVLNLIHAWSSKFLLLLMSLMPQIKGTFIKIRRFKMKPCPSQNKMTRVQWEQYHIILLSHIVLYWIWSSLDSNESLLVTGVSPSIFGLQHCWYFRKWMQLNMGCLRLNTLFLYNLSHNHFLYFLFFFFNFPSFCSLYFFFFYFLLQRMLILLGLSCCHKFQLHFMSLMPPIMERSSRLSVLKLSHAHLKTRW